MNASLDPAIVQLIAADLGVDASFVEKDWYAMRIIAALITVNPLAVRLAFCDCQITYQQNFKPTTSLRPHVKLEVTFKSPALSVEEKPLQSFIARARKQPPEVPTIACVSPIETAADKLSALTWRVLSRQRSREGDDPTLIRHLHDLTSLENAIAASEDFANLAVTLLEEDAQRGLDLSEIPPTERLQQMLQCLEDDSVYEDEYDYFVTGMSYAAENLRPSFSQALTTVRGIANRIS